MPYDLFTIARYIRARADSRKYVPFSAEEYAQVDRLMDHYAELRWAWTAGNA